MSWVVDSWSLQRAAQREEPVPCGQAPRIFMRHASVPASLLLASSSLLSLCP